MTALVVIPLLFSFFLLGCSKKEDKYYIENLKKMDSEGYSITPEQEKEIAKLKVGIQKYKKIVDEKVKAAEQLGVYYKMLAIRYLNNNMYQLALENLKEALKYYPENPILFYLSGVCYGRVAKSIVDDDEKRKSTLLLAEKYYRRAIELDNNYRDALFGLAVLYVFELNKPEAAIPLLEKLLTTQKSDTDAMFLLARTYYEVGKAEEAIDMYDRIIEVTKSKKRKEEAIKNKEIIEVEIHGK